LMIVLAMIGFVLLQKSEGGGLGIGSTGGFLSSRGTANVLTRTTAYLAPALFATSPVLSILAGMHPHPNSILPAPANTPPPPPRARRGPPRPPLAATRRPSRRRAARPAQEAGASAERSPGAAVAMMGNDQGPGNRPFAFWRTRRDMHVANDWAGTECKWRSNLL